MQSSLTGGSAPAVARVAAGRQSDQFLMQATINAAQADPSMAALVTALFGYAAGAGARVFGFYDSTANTIWGIKPYQGADPSSRPIGQGVSNYLSNPAAYPATPLPPPAVALTGISATPATLTAAGRFTLSVAISAAQSGAMTVGIAVDNPQYFIGPPSSITVAAGQTTGSVIGQVAPNISSPESATFSATLSYQTLDAEVSLMPFSPPFTLNPADSRASACVAFYPFYEGSGTTIHDCSGNGFHLLLQRGTIGTDAIWGAGPGAGTAGAGQYCMRVPAKSAFFSAVVTGLSVSQSAISAIMTIRDNQDPGEGPGYDAATACLEWYNPDVCQPIGRYAGGDNFYSQINDPAFSGAAAATPWFNNPTPSAWVQHGFASSPTGAAYWMGSQESTAGYPATPTGTLRSFGIPSNGYAGQFSGSIAGLAIFDRVLTAAELQRPLSGLAVPVPVATTGRPMRYSPSAAGARPPARKPAAGKAPRRPFRPR